MAQHNLHTLSGLKRSYAYFSFVPPLFPLALLFGTKSCALERKIVVVGFSPADKRSLAPGITSQVINCRVMCNLVDPGRKLKLRTITRKRPVDLNENFLG